LNQWTSWKKDDLNVKQNDSSHVGWKIGDKLGLSTSIKLSTIESVNKASE
jgi:hypothetical protein